MGKDYQGKENPDVLIGLFHAGPEGNKLDNVVENGSGDVAKNVPGFDVVFMGHDHVRRCEKIVNVAGDSVLLVDPANAARYVSDVTVKVTKAGGKLVRKSVEGALADVSRYAADEDFMREFAGQYQATVDFVSRKIGRIEETITTKDAYLVLLHLSICFISCSLILRVPIYLSVLLSRSQQKSRKVIFI